MPADYTPVSPTPANPHWKESGSIVGPQTHRNNKNALMTYALYSKKCVQKNINRHEKPLHPCPSALVDISSLASDVCVWHCVTMSGRPQVKAMLSITCISLPCVFSFVDPFPLCGLYLLHKGAAMIKGHSLSSSSNAMKSNPCVCCVTEWRVGQGGGWGWICASLSVLVTV